MESVVRAGLGLARPDCRNCSSYETVFAVGLVTDTDVVKTEPSAACTCPAAGAIRAVPGKPSGACDARARQQKMRERTAGGFRGMFGFLPRRGRCGKGWGEGWGRESE